MEELLNILSGPIIYPWTILPTVLGLVLPLSCTADCLAWGQRDTAEINGWANCHMSQLKSAVDGLQWVKNHAHGELPKIFSVSFILDTLNVPGKYCQGSCMGVAVLLISTHAASVTLPR
jgi:hypothetical protein